MPKSNAYIRGVAHIRGQTISVIDLSMAVGGRPIENIKDSFIIIAEYNRTVQGFYSWRSRAYCKYELGKNNATSFRCGSLFLLNGCN